MANGEGGGVGGEATTTVGGETPTDAGGEATPGFTGFTDFIGGGGRFYGGGDTLPGSSFGGVGDGQGTDGSPTDPAAGPLLAITALFETLAGAAVSLGEAVAAVEAFLWAYASGFSGDGGAVRDAMGQLLTPDAAPGFTGPTNMFAQWSSSETLAGTVATSQAVEPAPTSPSFTVYGPPPLDDPSYQTPDATLQETGHTRGAETSDGSSTGRGTVQGTLYGDDSVQSQAVPMSPLDVPRSQPGPSAPRAADAASPAAPAVPLLQQLIQMYGDLAPDLSAGPDLPPVPEAGSPELYVQQGFISTQGQTAWNRVWDPAAPTGERLVMLPLSLATVPLAAFEEMVRALL